MKIIKKIFSAIVLSAMLSGCSGSGFKTDYKVGKEVTGIDRMAVIYAVLENLTNVSSTKMEAKETVNIDNYKVSAKYTVSEVLHSNFCRESNYKLSSSETKNGITSSETKTAKTYVWLNEEHSKLFTGRTVKPKLIITCGVSGAIQFVAGMNGSERIVAINTDPEASIFNVAHIGICGDLYKIVPELIEEIKRSRKEA